MTAAEAYLRSFFVRFLSDTHLRMKNNKKHLEDGTGAIREQDQDLQKLWFLPYVTPVGV